MKVLTVIIIIVLALGLIYFLGPKVDAPNLSPGIERAKSLSSLGMDLKALEDSIRASESKVPGIKEDNEARIIWADSFAYQKSPYSLVYLHGFSASQGEGEPIHREFAKRYGCNLYLARLASHGVEAEEPLLDLTPEALVNTAKEAIKIGEQIGEKVIVMSTSTGGTLSLYLAAHNPEIASLICYSPNIDLYDPRSSLLTKPWGLQIARAVTGDDYREFEADEKGKQYWTTRYRLESIIKLKALVDATMTEETFSKVKQPVFVGYYYKNDEEQDKTVSIPRMMEMFDQLGTPESQKSKVALPLTGEHALASIYTSKHIESVIEATFKFAEEILALQPLE